MVLIKIVLSLCMSNEKINPMKNLKELTSEQLRNMSNVLNAARFVMEREFNVSENTIKELRGSFNTVESELNLRNKHIWNK